MCDLLTESEKKGTLWIIFILSQILKIFIGFLFKPYLRKCEILLNSRLI